MSLFIAEQLSILSDPLHIRILHLLQEGEFSVNLLSQLLHTPQHTISRHLKKIRKLCWIQQRTEGTANWLSFQPALLSDSDQGLWELIQRQSETLVCDDLQKAKTLLALRQTNSQDFFRRVSSSWSELRQNLFGDQFLLPTLLSMLPSSLTVADLGCGNGDTLIQLSPHVQEAIGIDQSSSMLQIATQRSTHIPNISLKLGSLEQLPLQSAYFDVALCLLVLHHVSALESIFTEISRILKPGGRLIILDMSKHQREEFTKTMGHQHLGFSKDDIHTGDLSIASWHELPINPQALGPPLFIATLTKPCS